MQALSKLQAVSGAGVPSSYLATALLSDKRNRHCSSVAVPHLSALNPAFSCLVFGNFLHLEILHLCTTSYFHSFFQSLRHILHSTAELTGIMGPKKKARDEDDYEPPSAGSQSDAEDLRVGDHTVAGDDDPPGSVSIQFRSNNL